MTTDPDQIREQIEETFQVATGAKFGSAELARAMLDGNFGDTKAASGGEDRHEAMEFAVETHFVENFATIGFHAAIVVV